MVPFVVFPKTEYLHKCYLFFHSSQYIDVCYLYCCQRGGIGRAKCVKHSDLITSLYLG